MSANSTQVGGSHYQVLKGLQHWDLVDDYKIGYLEAGAVKYLTRWRQKDGLKDLRKALHFIRKLYEKRSGMSFEQQVTRMPNVPFRVITEYAKNNGCDRDSEKAITLVLTWTSTGTIYLVQCMLSRMIIDEEALEANTDGSGPASSYVNQG
jgi:hypothetical protein